MHNVKVVLAVCKNSLYKLQKPFLNALWVIQQNASRSGLLQMHFMRARDKAIVVCFVCVFIYINTQTNER